MSAGQDQRRWVLFAACCVAFVLAGRPVPAAEGEGCAAAAWSLAQDGERLKAAHVEVANGGGVVLGEPAALILQLSPAAEAHLPFPPERTPAVDSFAGAVTLRLPATGGLVQVTLAQAAWIDLVGGDGGFKPVAFTGVRACALARKSVRFQVPAGPGPWVLQVSGASTDRLAVALSLTP